MSISHSQESWEWSIPLSTPPFYECYTFDYPKIKTSIQVQYFLVLVKQQSSLKVRVYLKMRANVLKITK